MNMFQLFGQTGMLYLFVSSLVYLSTTHAIHLANSPLNIDASLFLQKNVSIHHSVSKNDVNVVQALLSNDEPEPIVFEGFIQNSEGETDRVSSDVDTYTIFLPKLPDAVSANYQFYLDTANYFSFLPSKEDNTCEFTTTDYNAILTVDAGTPITNFFGKNGTRYIISPPNFISREIKLFRSGTSREGRLTCRMRTARAAGDFTQNAMKVTLSQHQLVTNQLILTETLINVGNISPHVYEANVPLALKNMAPTTPAAVFNIDDISYFDSEGNVDSKATISTVFPIFYSYYEESIPAGDYINVLLPIISLSMDTEYEFFISGVRISEDSYKPSYKYVFSSGDHLSETGELDSNGIRLVLVTIQLTKKIDFATIAAGGGAMIINGIPYITIRVTKARPLVDVIRRSFDFSKGGRFVASISSKDFHGQGYQYDYVRVISTNINAPSLPPVPMDVQVTASPDRAYAGKDNEYSFTFNIPENVCQGDSPYHFFELSLPSIIIPTFYVGLETDQTQSVTAIQRCNLYATSNPTVPLGVVSDVSISKMKINTNDDYLYVVTVDLTGQPSTKLSNVPHILKCTFTPGLRAFPAGIVARSHFIYRTNDYYDGSHCHAGQANLVFPAVEKPLSLPSSSDDYFGGIRSFALNYRNPYKATPTDSNDLFRVYFSPAHVSELQQRIELKMIPILTPTSKCIVLSRNGIEPLTIDTGITPTITGFDLTIAGIVTKSDLVIECTNLNNSSPYSFTTIGPYNFKKTVGTTTTIHSNFMVSWAERIKNSKSNDLENLITGLGIFSTVTSQFKYFGSPTSNLIAQQKDVGVGIGFATLQISLRDFEVNALLVPNKDLALVIRPSITTAGYFVSDDAISKAMNKPKIVEVYLTNDAEFPTNTASLQNLYASNKPDRFYHETAHNSVSLLRLRLSTSDYTSTKFGTTSTLHIRIHDVLRRDIAEITNELIDVSIEPYDEVKSTDPVELLRLSSRSPIILAPFLIDPTTNDKINITVSVPQYKYYSSDTLAPIDIDSTSFLSLRIGYPYNVYTKPENNFGVAPNDLGSGQGHRLLGENIQFSLPDGVHYVEGRTLCSHEGHALTITLANRYFEIVTGLLIDERSTARNNDDKLINIHNGALVEVIHSLRAVFSYEFNSGSGDGYVYFICNGLLYDETYHDHENERMIIENEDSDTSTQFKTQLGHNIDTAKSKEFTVFTPNGRKRYDVKAPVFVDESGATKRFAKYIKSKRTSDSAGGSTELTLDVHVDQKAIKPSSLFHIFFSFENSLTFDYNGTTAVEFLHKSTSYNGIVVNNYKSQGFSILFKMPASMPAIRPNDVFSIRLTKLRNSRNLQLFNEQPRFALLQAFENTNEFLTTRISDSFAESFKLDTLLPAKFGGSNAILAVQKAESSAIMGQFYVHAAPLSLTDIDWTKEQKFHYYISANWMVESDTKADEIATGECSLHIYDSLEFNGTENLLDANFDITKYGIPKVVVPVSHTFDHHQHQIEVPEHLDGSGSYLPPAYLTVLGDDNDDGGHGPSPDEVTKLYYTNNRITWEVDPILSSEYTYNPMDEVVFYCKSDKFKLKASRFATEKDPNGSVLQLVTEDTSINASTYINTPEITVAPDTRYLLWTILLDYKSPIDTIAVTRYSYEALSLVIQSIFSGTPDRNPVYLGLGSCILDAEFSESADDETPLKCREAPINKWAVLNPSTKELDTHGCMLQAPHCKHLLLAEIMRGSSHNFMSLAAHHQALLTSQNTVLFLRTPTVIDVARQVVTVYYYHVDNCAKNSEGKFVNADKPFCHDSLLSIDMPYYSKSYLHLDDENPFYLSQTDSAAVFDDEETLNLPVSYEPNPSATERYTRKATYADNVVVSWDLTLLEMDHSLYLTYFNLIRGTLIGIIGDPSTTGYGIVGFLHQLEAKIGEMIMAYDSFPSDAARSAYLESLRQKYENDPSQENLTAYGTFKALLENIDMLRDSYKRTVKLIDDKVRFMTSVDADIASMPSTCDDTKVNNDETDVDCGGPTCKQCEGGRTCLVNSDCLTNSCDRTDHTCKPFENRIPEDTEKRNPRSDKLESPALNSASFEFVSVWLLITVMIASIVNIFAM